IRFNEFLICVERKKNFSFGSNNVTYTLSMLAPGAPNSLFSDCLNLVLRSNLAALAPLNDVLVRHFKWAFNPDCQPLVHPRAIKMKLKDTIPKTERIRLVRNRNSLIESAINEIQKRFEGHIEIVVIIRGRRVWNHILAEHR